MPFAALPDRALITVSGHDAEHFLQNILTVDLDALKDGEAKPGALLSPQGKILFDFLISRAGEKAFRLECREDVADDFTRRLMLYRLRAKAEIDKQDHRVVAAAWGNDSGGSQSDSAPSDNDSIRLVDTRFRLEPVFRVYSLAAPQPLAPPRKAEGDSAALTSPSPLREVGFQADAYRALRVANAVAESGDDYALGDAFPHDVLLDQTGGVGFKKGCYVGQEVVSRMQHRGTARRRVLCVASAGALPAPGTDLTVDGRSAGTLGSVSGQHGLAIVRIDRIKAAMDAGKPILAGEAPVMVSIPGWVNFTYPQDSTAEGA